MSDIDKNIIVIVEDESELNMLIRLEMEKAGYKTQSLYSGEETLKWISENFSENIFFLFDYQLSDMESLELIPKIKVEYSEISFMVLTGKGDEKIAVEMMKMGAYDYIVKEGNFIKLLPSRVEKSINQKNLKIELAAKQKEILISEHKYRSIFENIQDVYFEIDFNGMIKEISPSVDALFLQPREQLLNENIQKFFFNPKDFEYFIKLIQISNQLDNYEMSLITKDQEKKFCTCTCKTIEYPDIAEKIIIGSIRDITESKKMERTIMNKVVETEEKDRKKFAEELHDGLGPILSTIKMYMDLIEKSAVYNPESSKNEIIKNIFDLLDESIKFSNSIANNLVPNIISDYGLIVAIKTFCNKIIQTGKIKISLEFQLRNKRLNEILEVILYRTLIEFINNTLKHAQAKNIRINILQENNHLNVIYEDDGIGFDSERILNHPETAEGVGLINVVNRLKSFNGTISFDTKNKTKINIRLDLENFL